MYELGGESDQRGESIHFHLSHNVCAIDLNGVLCDPQLECSLLVLQTANQQRQHSSLSCRQSLISRDELFAFDCLSPILAVLLECPFNGLDEGSIINRFGKEVNLPSPHRSY